MLRGVRWQYLGLACLLLVSCNTNHKPRVSPESEYRKAQSLYKNRQMPECLEQARATLKTVRRDAHPGLYFRLRLMEASCLIGLKDQKSALQILSEPLPDHTLNTADTVFWRIRQGTAHVYSGEFETAATLLNQALTAAEQSGSRSLVAEVEARLGSLALRTRDHAAAERLLRRALQVAEEEGNTSLRTSVIGNLGVLLTSTYRLNEAVYWQERAAAEFRDNGDSDSLARVTGNLGWSLLLLGDLEGALVRFQEAEAKFAKAGNRTDQLTWLGNIGNVHLQRDDYAAAEASYTQAAKLAREMNNRLELQWWVNKMASLAIARRDWKLAERLNNESAALSAEMKDDNDDLELLNNTAAVAAGQGRIAEAEEIYRKVAAGHSQNPVPILNAHSGLAEMYAAAGNTAKARHEYQTTLALVEEQRDLKLEDRLRLPYIEGRIRFYRKYVDFLVEQNDVAGALRIADRSHAQMLRQAGHGASPDYRQIARRTNSVLLAYWLAPGRSYLWAITPDVVKLHHLPASAKIRSYIAQHNGFLTNLGNPVDGGGLAGEKLWEILVGPVADLVAKTGRVIVVPDGSLYALNLESLPVLQPRPHYWIEDATISVVPALRLLRPGAETGERNSLLLIGDPVPSGPEFPRLPHAAEEVSEIERRFSDSPRLVLRGGEASPAGYAQSNPSRFSLIHFAAHASSNPDNPLQSAIVLSRDQQRHLLPAADVMKIPLRAQLVTISACSSAGSRIYSGEGLVGLTWAFLRAGAKGVIAGLWDVPDRDTSRLMGHLYEGLAKGEPPESALRKAKLEMLATHTLPYNWAAFQHYAGSY